MVSLVDIGPLTKKVPIREGVDLDVVGLSAQGLFSLLDDYPELRMLLAGKRIEGDIVATLIEGFPGTIAGIIAAGTGKAGDRETIAAALRLTIGEQVLILTAMAELTFPQGVRSFVESLQALAQQAGVSGWAAVTKSPAPSPSASATATASSEAGDTHQDSSQPGPSSSTENSSENNSDSQESSGQHPQT